MNVNIFHITYQHRHTHIVSTVNYYPHYQVIVNNNHKIEDSMDISYTKALNI